MVYLAYAPIKKSLTYDVLLRIRLLRVGDQLKPKVQILFEGAPVDNAYLVAIMFRNSGRVPITIEDFAQHMAVSFGEGSTILDADTSYAKPNALKPRFVIESDRLVFSPLLLNPGDRFVLRALVSRSSARPVLQVQSRIKGVSDVKPPAYLREWLIGVGGLALWSGVAVALVVFLGPKLGPVWQIALGIIALLGGALLSAVVFFRPESERRSIRLALVERYTGEPVLEAALSGRQYADRR